ncbi:MAG: GAF and ANTAR domain-containing protein [Egibacteraceae bacterium]
MQTEQILTAMVEFADTLINHFDVDDFLHRLCERCVEVFDVSSAGVSLASAVGVLAVAAGSDPTVELVERLQAETQEGPSREVFYSGVQVVEPNLHTTGLRRWPRFAPAALEAGVPAAVFVFPLRLREERIGALALFRGDPGPFDHAEVRAAQALADIATIGILQARAIAEKKNLTSQLQQALDSRVLIEQAKGMVAAHGSLAMRDAFEQLRLHGRRTGRSLRDVAQDVVDGSLILPRSHSIPKAR